MLGEEGTDSGLCVVWWWRPAVKALGLASDSRLDVFLGWPNGKIGSRHLSGDTAGFTLRAVTMHSFRERRSQTVARV